MARGKRVPALLLLGAILGAIALGISFGQSGGGDVRVAFQRLDDGRGEIAVQIRGADGSWSAPLRPERRFVPADAEPGRWLYSSPVAAEGGGAAFKLGMLSIRSSPYEAFNDYARRIEHGARLAVEHVNAAGGVWGRPVELAIADTGGDPEAAAVQARRLIEEEGVHAVVGPITSRSLQAVGETIAPEFGVPFVSPSATAPIVTALDDDGYVFRTIISDAAQADVLAQLAEEEGYDEAAVVYRDDLWGRTLHRHFIDHYHGEASSIALDPDPDGNDYPAKAAEAAASGARVLVLITVPDETIAILRAAAELDAFDTYLFEHTNKRIDIYEQFPAELEGAEGVAYVGRHVTEAEGHWEADYRAMFDEDPSDAFANPREAYDAAITLMLAAERAGSANGALIRNALPAVGGPPGQRFPASSAGVAGALAAIRAGGEIDLDGEATALDWGPNGDIILGHMEYWRFQDGGIVRVRDFDIRIEPERIGAE